MASEEATLCLTDRESTRYQLSDEGKQGLGIFLQTPIFSQFLLKGKSFSISVFDVGAAIIHHCHVRSDSIIKGVDTNVYCDHRYEIHRPHQSTK